MRFVGVALPRVLARPPWEDDGTRADGFRYAEYAPTAEHRVWMSAGLCLRRGRRARLRRHSPGPPMCAASRPIGSAAASWTDAAARAVPAPIPAMSGPASRWRSSVNDRQERELLDAGLMPLSLPFRTARNWSSVRCAVCWRRNAITGPTAAAADANARLSSQINSILCASRFAHHLKIMGRHMVGSFKTADEIERLLQDLADQLRQRQPVGGRGKPSALSAGGRTRHVRRTYRASRAASAASCTCSRTISLTTLTATSSLVTDIGGASEDA